MTNNNHTYYVLLGTLLAVTVIAITSALNPVIAQGQKMIGGNATAQNMTDIKFLFIQNAQSGSISKVNATTSTLELNDISDSAILFSDRPNRIVGSEDTTDFIGNWSMGGPNSFALDPPNAVLVLDDEEHLFNRLT